MADTAVKIPFQEDAAPSTPAATKVVIYAKSDGLMYSKDDAGVETLMSGGAGGGSVATDAIWDAAGDLAVGTGANTAARMAKGVDDTVLRMVGGAVAWSQYGQLLGHKVYSVSNTTYNQTSATLGDADATNLAVVFTAPASGNVIVKLSGVARQPASVGAGARAFWGLRESTTIIAGPMYVLYAASVPAANVLEAKTVAFYVSGVSAGSHTYKWAIAGDGTYGGGLYIDTAFHAVMEVVAVS